MIDEARWWHDGRRWCHMISDVSYAELIAFADEVGIPRRGFEGDHYDIPEEYRDAMIAAGATAVESRVLLRRLKAAELRLRPRQRHGAKGAAAAAAALAAHDAAADIVT